MGDWFLKFKKPFLYIYKYNGLSIMFLANFEEINQGVFFWALHTDDLSGGDTKTDISTNILTSTLSITLLSVYYSMFEKVKRSLSEVGSEVHS